LSQSLSRAVSTAAITSALILAGCGGSASNSGSGSGDARAAAIQKALDARPVIGAVRSGRLCGRPEDFAHIARLLDPKAYTHVPGAHITPNGTKHRVGGGLATEPCMFLSWDASTGIINSPTRDYGAETSAKMGRFVVDKVGDEQDGPMGKTTPYKAHFEPNDLAKALIAAGIVERPADVNDGPALLHKDADGQWVAQL
jgi:hypothetical protein